MTKITSVMMITIISMVRGVGSRRNNTDNDKKHNHKNKTAVRTSFQLNLTQGPGSLGPETHGPVFTNTEIHKHSFCNGMKICGIGLEPCAFSYHPRIDRLLAEGTLGEAQFPDAGLGPMDCSLLRIFHFSIIFRKYEKSHFCYGSRGITVEHFCTIRFRVVLVPQITKHWRLP